MPMNRRKFRRYRLKCDQKLTNRKGAQVKIAHQGLRGCAAERVANAALYQSFSTKRNYLWSVVRTHFLLPWILAVVVMSSSQETSGTGALLQNGPEAHN